MYIKGFRIKIGDLECCGDQIENFKSTHFGSATLLSSEAIIHQDQEAINATASHYCPVSGIITFLFESPRHEMSFSETFLEAAQGIIPGKSNLELIYA